VGDDIFDEILKVYRDIKRAREKLEGIIELDLSNDEKVVLNKIRNENRKIYDLIKSAQEDSKNE